LLRRRLLPLRLPPVSLLLVSLPAPPLSMAVMTPPGLVLKSTAEAVA
jgi:hypothetical protein